MPKLEVHGFHGTALSNAQSILQEGFKVDNPEAVVCFATPDDDHDQLVARIAGMNRAERQGEDHYAVIEATFPPRGALLVKDGYFMNQVRVKSNELGLISIQNVVVYPVRPPEEVSRSERLMKYMGQLLRNR